MTEYEKRQLLESLMETMAKIDGFEGGLLVFVDKSDTMMKIRGDAPSVALMGAELLHQAPRMARGENGE